MIERIQKNLTSSIILIYQHDKAELTHHFLPGIIRTLQDEGYPNHSTSIKIIYWKYVKNIVIIEPKVAHFIKRFVNQVNSLQTNLQTEDLIKYEDLIITSKIRIPGVIGGHHNKLKIFKKYFIKKMGGNHVINEIFNYYLLNKLYPKVTPFLTKCYGVIFVSKEFEVNEAKMTQIIQSGKQSSKDFIFYPMSRYFRLLLIKLKN